MDENIFSIMMFIFGGALLLYSGISYLTGDTMIMHEKAYSIPQGKKKKPYVRKLSKVIALIALSFIASSLVGLTEIYWLAVIVLLGGIIGTCILGKKIMNSPDPK